MKWKRIGDILILNKKINDVEYFKKKGIKTIVKIEKIEGKVRKPEIKILYGSETETIHKENNCLFKLDISKVMWSKGNTYERMRIAKLVNKDETVVDMFAGIGYFSIPIAVHSQPKKVFAIEINPTAFKYLKENIKLNKVEKKVFPILGDCGKIAPELDADRVIMGYLPDPSKYLDSAMQCISDRGIIHYHEAVPDKLGFKRPINRIKSAAKDKDVKILHKRVVKKYAPGVSHVVIDALIH